VLFRSEGINIENLHQHISEHGTIKNFPGAILEEDGKSVLEKDCDILIPAALESQITLENAERISAKIIIEAANGPITYGADEILNQKGTIIIPDAYANAGGVTVSYFEWIRNISHMRFGRMHKRLDEKRGSIIAETIELLTEGSIPSHLRNDLIAGASEIDVVRSGLEDAMRVAFQSIKQAYDSNPDIKDLRTAAYVQAIKKISRSYLDIGIY